MATSSLGFIIQEMSAAPAIPRWPDESRKIQSLFDAEWDVAEDYEMMSRQLPEQHRLFHSRNISFMPLAVRDDDLRIWVGMLSGDEGQPGFIRAPNASMLQIHAKTWRGDPVPRFLASHHANDVELPVAGVGVELTTRRRNKVAGMAKAVYNQDLEVVDVDVRVTQALGNCPKYITVRNLEPNPSLRTPTISHEQLRLDSNEELPPEIRAFILERDTCFLGTAYRPTSRNASTFEEFLGCNHRGGRPGFIRVRTDNRTIVLPDLSGNRHWSSLGNIESNPVAGLMLPNFETGDVLYVTGQAKNYALDEAKKFMPRAKLLTTITVTGYTLVRNALPFRQSKDPSTSEPSPYSPPIYHLVEEVAQESVQDVTAKLVNVEFHLPRGVDDIEGAELATFSFETSRDINAKPGSFAVLDLSPLLGQYTYRHMSIRGSEQTVNDDGVRTWTISSAPGPRQFSLTIKKLPKGRVTPRLFANAARIQRAKLANDGTFVPKLELPFLGVGGNFLLPAEDTEADVRLLLIAGNIGVTPFLRFIEAINSGAQGTAHANWKVQLLVATRDPFVMADLIQSRLGDTVASNLELSVLLVSSKSVDSKDKVPPLPTGMRLEHGRRLNGHDLKFACDELATENKEISPEVYLCGPPAFERAMLAELEAASIGTNHIHQESFSY
ncbi:hypothetical protein OIO90_006028 [Microbotryomycetes sp. JL221]|nr:hypothetical protein OIO90_006028 [Microbotryomycetes sp. JL221]